METLTVFRTWDVTWDLITSQDFNFTRAIETALIHWMFSGAEMKTQYWYIAVLMLLAVAYLHIQKAQKVRRNISIHFGLIYVLLKLNIHSVILALVWSPLTSLGPLCSALPFHMRDRWSKKCCLCSFEYDLGVCACVCPYQPFAGHDAGKVDHLQMGRLRDQRVWWQRDDVVAYPC